MTFWTAFAIGSAVGAVVVLPTAIAIKNWLDLRYMRQLSNATRLEQEAEMRKERP